MGEDKCTSYKCNLQQFANLTGYLCCLHAPSAELRSWKRNLMAHRGEKICKKYFTDKGCRSLVQTTIGYGQPVYWPRAAGRPKAKLGQSCFAFACNLLRTTARRALSAFPPHVCGLLSRKQNGHLQAPRKGSTMNEILHWFPKELSPSCQRPLGWCSHSLLS